MRIISLDISKKSTGLATYYNGLVHTETLTGYDMAGVVVERVGSYIDMVPANEQKPVIVVEWYSDTLTHNDRTNTAEELKRLASTIIQELHYKKGVPVVGFMPWSWRKVFNLPTLVKADGQSVKYQMVAKIIGHDILKKQSVDLVQNNKKQFGLIRDITSDDEAEAVLLIHAFISLGIREVNTPRLEDSKHYKIHQLTREDLRLLADSDDFNETHNGGGIWSDL